jgi:hypothetical protein
VPCANVPRTFRRRGLASAGRSRPDRLAAPPRRRASRQRGADAARGASPTRSTPRDGRHPNLVKARIPARSTFFSGVGHWPSQPSRWNAAVKVAGLPAGNAHRSHAPHNPSSVPRSSRANLPLPIASGGFRRFRDRPSTEQKQSERATGSGRAREDAPEARARTAEIAEEEIAEPTRRRLP